jgi:hypothetical protein
MRRMLRSIFGGLLFLAAVLLWYLWFLNVSSAIVKDSPSSETNAIVYYVATILTFTGAAICFLWDSGARTWYGLGVPLYLGTLLMGGILNRRDQIGGSWTDPYFQVSTWVGFFCSVIAPFRLKRSYKERCLWLAVTVAGSLAAWWLWYVSTA